MCLAHRNTKEYGFACEVPADPFGYRNFTGKSKAHEDKLYSADDLATMLRTAADIDGNQKITIPNNKAFISKAFVNKLEPDEYTLSYEAPHFKHKRDENVLYY